jgi:hypothetical protein
MSDQVHLSGDSAMRKIRFAIPAIAVGLAIGSPGVAFAAPQPVAGCSNGYELTTVKSVLHTLAGPRIRRVHQVVRCEWRRLPLHQDHSE